VEGTAIGVASAAQAAATRPRQIGRDPLIFVWTFVWLALTLKWYAPTGSYALWAWLAFRLSYGAVTAYLGYTGVFRRNTKYLLPTFVALAGVFVDVAGVLLPGRLQDEVAAMLSAIPLPWLLAVQYPRLLAFVTFIKWYNGTFPTGWAWGVGLADFIYAVPMAVVHVLLTQGYTVSNDTLLLVSIPGILVAPFAVVFMYVYLPSPWGIWYTAGKSPDTREVLSWPMVLMPSHAIPFLVEIQVFTLIKALVGFY
ncbi:unnamed protein product, partial [Vitrella brassicaformis CCMP3155]